MSFGPKCADIYQKVTSTQQAVAALISSTQANIAAMQNNDGSNDLQTVLLNALVADLQSYSTQLTAMANGMLVIANANND